MIDQLVEPEVCTEYSHSLPPPPKHYQIKMNDDASDKDDGSDEDDRFKKIGRNSVMHNMAKNFPYPASIFFITVDLDIVYYLFMW